MFDSNKHSYIEKTRKALYSRGGKTDDYTSRHSIKMKDDSVPGDWQPSPDEGVPSPIEPKKRLSFSKIIFFLSTIFFTIAAGVAFYVFFAGNHLISADNIDIQIEGPVSVVGGETVTLNVSLINKNATPIHSVDLVVIFPDGTKNPLNISDDLSRERMQLGTIMAGGVTQKKIEMVLFGLEDEKKEIKFTVEYRTNDSNAIFFKEKSYEIVVGSSPVLIDIDAFDSITSGRELVTKVTVSSNSTSPLKDLLLVVDYPFGFSFTGSDPAPLFSSNVFKVGDLSPTAKRTFIIRGSIEGQDGEERVLRTNVGIQSKSNEREIATSIISNEHNFTIEKPFVGLTLALNGSLSGDYAVSPGNQVRGDVVWTSNLPTRITNAAIELKFSGNILDRNSVASTKGVYNSSNNTITWDSRNNPSLALISPGDRGELSFSFSSLRMAPGLYPSNPEINLSLSIRGTRIDEGKSAEELSGTVVRSAKISPDLVFTSGSFYSSGSLKNSGPIPPKVDEKTTYTIVWTISSAASSMSDGEVRAVLPPYVEWLNTVSPEADVRFNPVGGEVVWIAGDIPSFVNSAGAKKQVAFQVAITPSVKDVGSILELIDESNVSAIDDFSGLILRARTTSLNTIASDPGFLRANGIVVE